jgi:O-antigen ligase
LFAWLVSSLAAIAIMAKSVMIFILSLTSTQFMILGAALVIISPLLIATLSAQATKKFGYLWFRSRVVMAVLLSALACELLALWFSFSRGGIIALAGTAVLCAILYTWSSKTRPAIAKAATAATALTMAAIALVGEAGFAQNPVEAPSAPAESAPGEPGIGEINLSASDLADTASFMIRVTYWKVGLTMIQDNFWTGVGLGNFGTAYAKYQYLGAGDVQAAHNAYLQFFCETGVFGFLAFSADSMAARWPFSSTPSSISISTIPASPPSSSSWPVSSSPGHTQAIRERPAAKRNHGNVRRSPCPR